MEEHNSKLNWLRAAVLGANDGIVSVASVVVGVAGANTSKHFILLAGVAAMIAGAFSMAVGEYVSVSTQRDTEKIIFTKNKKDFKHEDLTNPWHAFFASGLSFFSGAIIPILAVLFAPRKFTIIATFLAFIFALVLNGTISAHAGGASKRQATIRVLIGGVLAMAITYGVGFLFGVGGI